MLNSIDRLKITLLCLCLLSMSGCATVFGKKSQQVAFDSTPQGADVYIDDIRIGKTPIAVNLLLNVKRSNIKIYRKKSAEMHAKVMKDPSIKTHQDEDVEDAASEYKVSIVKEGFKVLRLTISPQRVLSSSVNSGLCRFDIVLSIFTFGATFLIDVGKYACAGFESVYSFDLSTGMPTYMPAKKSLSGVSSGTSKSSGPLILGGISSGVNVPLGGRV